MKLIDSLRDREQARRMLEPTDRRFVTGSDKDRAEARALYRRQTAAAKVFNSDRREIARSDLASAHFGLLEHTGDGTFWKTTAGDPEYMDAATAYYCDSEGWPVLLEPAGSRAELDEARAKREAARRAPKQRPSWMT